MTNADIKDIRELAATILSGYLQDGMEPTEEHEAELAEEISIVVAKWLDEHNFDDGSGEDEE